jgi:small subunit ribosomal protein S8
MMNDTLAAVLSHIQNYESSGKKLLVTSCNSKLICKVLDIMKTHGYIGEYEIVEDGRAGTLKINLIGNINKVGVIKPRFNVAVNDIEKFEKNFLPAKDFGLIILSTSKGVLTHIEAKEHHVGGKLISYVY